MHRSSIAPLTLVGLCLAAMPSMIAAKPVLNTRQNSCQAIASYSISNTDGGYGEAPFTNINSGFDLYNNGNAVYSNSDNTFADEYSTTIDPDQWGGSDTLYFESLNNAGDASYESCYLTDTTSGANYTGTVSSGYDEGTVTVQTSSCTVNFSC